MELRHTIAARLGRLHNRVSPWSSNSDPIDTQWLGEYGELVAASYLRAQGYKVLRRNFRWANSGEIDLVLRHGETLVFTEVKTRRSTDYRSPLAVINREKRQLLRRGAHHWCHLLWRDDIPKRFDVIEIILPAQSRPQIKLHQGIFGAKEGQARPVTEEY